MSAIVLAPGKFAARVPASSPARVPAPPAAVKPAEAAAPARPRRQPLLERHPDLVRNALRAALPPLLGIALFIAFWGAISAFNPSLPGPVKTWASAVEVFSRPFYQNGPNDQGIGWNILSSLQRVGLGFGLAALLGIPLGFVLGRFGFLSGMAAPVISLLRPVSPLAWLPIGLLVFKAANPASIWV